MITYNKLATAYFSSWGTRFNDIQISFQIIYKTPFCQCAQTKKVG